MAVVVFTHQPRLLFFGGEQGEEKEGMFFSPFAQQSIRCYVNKVFLFFQVCSSCSLRNSCERAYLITNKEDEARTIDVMRVLLTYGFDPINGSVENKSLLKQKSVKNIVRKLLHEVVRLSAVPIDPNLPPPVIKPRPPKVKQPPPPPKKRVGRDDVEMKKGDWLCPKYVSVTCI